MKNIAKYAWTLWLAAGTVIFYNSTFLDWKWWAFCLPMVLFVFIYKHISD